MVPSPATAQSVSRALGSLAVLTMVVATGFLLTLPLTDAFVAGWLLLGVALAVSGGVGAWTNRPGLVWVAALLLAALSVLGMWSIGFLVAPAAVLLFGAAASLRWAGPRPDDRTAVATTPPPLRDTLLKTGVGIVAVAAGGWLIYGGAVARDLFGACATETLACVLGNVHWGGVGLTLIGLSTLGVGGWLLWKQLHWGRVLAADLTG